VFIVPPEKSGGSEAKFSGEELSENVCGRQAFAGIGFGHRFAFVVPGEAAQDSDNRFELSIAQLFDHGVRRFFEFLSVHAPIVADLPC
jgi:hypothetical protein